MKRYLILYFATLLTMAPLDVLFIGKISKPVFNADVGNLLSQNPNMPAAILFYLLYIAGVLVFASANAVSWMSALLYSALFGFMCYMTFELTNRIIIESWTWRLVLIDTAWGTFVTAFAGTVGWLIAKALVKA